MSLYNLILIITGSSLIISGIFFSALAIIFFFYDTKFFDKRFGKGRENERR